MVEWRRPLGNVYTTLVMAAVCGLSLWATVPAMIAASDPRHSGFNGGDTGDAYAQKTKILAAQKAPLAMLCVISGSLIALRVLGIPFLALRGWILNVIVTLFIVGLFVMSVLFITQTIPTYNNYCGGDSFYYGIATNSSGGKSGVELKEKYTCFYPDSTYYIFYITYAGISALALVWRLFGGSF